MIVTMMTSWPQTMTPTKTKPEVGSLKQSHELWVWRKIGIPEEFYRMVSYLGRIDKDKWCWIKRFIETFFSSVFQDHKTWVWSGSNFYGPSCPDCTETWKKKWEKIQISQIDPVKVCSSPRISAFQINSPKRMISWSSWMPLHVVILPPLSASSSKNNLLAPTKILGNSF